MTASPPSKILGVAWSALSEAEGYVAEQGMTPDDAARAALDSRPTLSNEERTRLWSVLVQMMTHA